MQQQHPHGGRPDHHSPQPFTLDIAALAALDAALARDHAAQRRAEAGPTATPADSFAAALAAVGGATL